MKIVVDANILIASIFWNGPPYKIIQHALDGKITVLTSPQVLAEVRNVLLDGDEFGLTLQETEDIISAILSYAQLVHPTAPIPAVSRDPKDNHILALAKETTASAIVTRDKDLLVLKTYDKIPIQPPEAFLKRLVTDQVLQS